jgi:LAS superfamily LD-carboxypeptidase LdcB
MLVPRETAPPGAGTDTASARPSAADAGLRTREEHAEDRTRRYWGGATGLVRSSWHGERRTLGDKYVPRHASPPAYSQHTIASKAAIDFKNVDGSPSDTDPGDFAYTAEYAWLREHAVQFQFYESWPPGNEFGMRAEPWHWQYRPPHE